MARGAHYRFGLLLRLRERLREPLAGRLAGERDRVAVRLREPDARGDGDEGGGRREDVALAPPARVAEGVRLATLGVRPGDEGAATDATSDGDGDPVPGAVPDAEPVADGVADAGTDADGKPVPVTVIEPEGVGVADPVPVTAAEPDGVAV